MTTIPPLGKSDNPQDSGDRVTEVDVPIPPRVEEARYGGDIASLSGQTLLIPDMSLIEAIEAETKGKVEYFPTPAEFQSDEWVNREGAFAYHIIRGIVERVDRDYPDLPIVLRGVAVSINGDIDVIDSGYYTSSVRDATVTAKKGIEKPSDSFNVVQHIHGTNVSSNYGLKHMSEYAARVGFEEIYQDAKPRPDLFPAILVYREDMLERTGSRYGVKFKNGVIPQEALLKVFVTDKSGPFDISRQKVAPPDIDFDPLDDEI